MILASAESIREWTAKGVWGTKTLVDYFKENVAKTPDALALVDPPNREALTGIKAERLTFRELDRAVDATAEALIRKGIGKDDIVMVQLPNTWELAMLYLAINRAGALISPMPMAWRQSEIGVHPRPDRSQGLHHGRRIFRVQAQGDGRKAPARVSCPEGNHLAGRTARDVPGGSHREA